MIQTALSHPARLLQITPGDLLRITPAEGVPCLVRFIALEPDGRLTYEEVSLIGAAVRRTVPSDEFTRRFDGATIDLLGCIMPDQEWATLAAYLRLAADHDLGPKDLMEFYRFFTALAPAAPTG